MVSGKIFVLLSGVQITRPLWSRNTTWDGALTGTGKPGAIRA